MEDGPDQVRVTISDEGPGIAAEDRERALQPFVRLEPSRNSETGGFGLGLTIADAVIRGHGGSHATRQRRGSAGSSSASFFPSVSRSQADTICYKAEILMTRWPR